jgi:DNA polymerase
VQPKIILAVGRIAAQNLLATDEPVGRMRGRAYDLDGIPLVVTYHPAYLLRSPSQKQKSWSDLCLARRLVSEAGT